MAQTGSKQVLDIINNSMKSIGALAAGETLESSAANDAFVLLNDMLDQWSNSPYMIFNINEIIFNIIPGQYVYSIGLGAYINQLAPLYINQAFVRINNLDYPIDVISVDDYEAIGFKSLNGPWPRALYYNLGATTSTINLWPKPSQGEMHLITNDLLTQFSTINDVLNLPQGYSMAIMWNLAQILLPQFSGNATPELVARIDKFAADGLAFIKRTNMQPMPMAQFDSGLTTSNSKDASWILRGGY